MQKVILFLSLICFSAMAFATHNLAGDITYRHISGLTYEIIVTVYADSDKPAFARKDIEISYGDNTGRDSIDSPIETPVLGKPNISKRVWRTRHTYPGGAASYIIRVEDRNRNGGVNNMVNSENVPFTVETRLRIPIDRVNNSIILLNDPLDDACTGATFIYNPGAFDPDGDSVAYEIAPSKGFGGLVAPGYEFPSASDSIVVDPISGDLIWEKPNESGLFNVAILMREFRNGIEVGNVLRDIQINVIPGCNNQPPKIFAEQLVCVEADSNVIIEILGTDTDSQDQIILTATGEFFEAGFPNPPSLSDFNQYDKPVTASLSWNTNCDNVRLAPYFTSIKAEDDAFRRNTTSLTNFKTIGIRVVAPAPENFIATPIGTAIQLSWDNNRCRTADGYFLYRRRDSSGFVGANCNVGVPEGIGYEKIATIDGIDNTSFLDDNEGEGLVPGQKYCYLVTKFFSDGDESYASEEVCAEVPKIIPVITNVSISSTDVNAGTVELAWSPPDSFDMQAFPAPYRYLVYKSIQGALEAVDSTNSLTDTTLTDVSLNTTEEAHTYQVRLFSYGNGKQQVGRTAKATSIFLSISPTDEVLRLSWTSNVPWQNDSFAVFRRPQGSTDFDSIATTRFLTYNDSNLTNEREYCYYIKAFGKYNLKTVKRPLVNLSQEACKEPIDNISPCAPIFTLDGNCDEGIAEIKWMNPIGNCASDVSFYRIYKSKTVGGELLKVDSTDNPSDSFLTFTGEISGCYVVASVDSADNESNLGDKKCIDFCPEYELPNVFTPNGDGVNDLFIPIQPYRDVDSIDMVIFNRWGEEIFQTSNPDIIWDGTHQEIKVEPLGDLTNRNSDLVSGGIYFYVCKVFEFSISGAEPRILQGTITVLDPKPIKGNK